MWWYILTLQYHILSYDLVLITSYPILSYPVTLYCISMQCAICKTLFQKQTGVTEMTSFYHTVYDCSSANTQCFVNLHCIATYCKVLPLNISGLFTIIVLKNIYLIWPYVCNLSNCTIMFCVNVALNNYIIMYGLHLLSSTVCIYRYQNLHLKAVVFLYFTKLLCRLVDHHRHVGSSLASHPIRHAGPSKPEFSLSKHRDPPNTRQNNQTPF